MPLKWEKNPFEEINICLNRRIEEIYILEHSMISDINDDNEKKNFFRQLTNTDYFIVGIEFKLEGVNNCLQISNGLDCNLIKIETSRKDSRYRKIKIE